MTLKSFVEIYKVGKFKKYESYVKWIFRFFSDNYLSMKIFELTNETHDLL